MIKENTKKHLYNILNQIDYLLESIENNNTLDTLLYFSHNGRINPSASEYYYKYPERGNDLLRRTNRNRRVNRPNNYFDRRQKIEDYMRSKLSELNVTPKHNFPIYSILDLGYIPERFYPGDNAIRLPIDVLKNNITFTIGDSFQAFTRMSNMNRRNCPISNELFNLQGIKNIGRQELLKRVELIRNTYTNYYNTPPDYIECQIWHNADYLNSIR